MKATDIVRDRRGTTIRFPEPIRRAMKIHAVRKDVAMNEFVIEAVRDRLRREDALDA